MYEQGLKITNSQYIAILQVKESRFVPDNQIKNNKKRVPAKVYR